MKKFLLALLAGCALTASAQGVYQIPNSDFESWSSSSVLNGGWYSFESASGKWNSFKGSSPAPSRITGHNGYGVQIYSKSVMGKKANGNLTTGRVNMGSTTPANSSNYNYSDRSGGYALQFAGRPDAVELYAKFTSGGSPNGRVQFILHDDCDYRDPELNSQSGNRVGKAIVLIPATSDWTKFTAEFTYDKATPATQYMLASATTNPTPGGSKDDYLSLDDINLIYYHALTDLKYDGQTVSGFAEGTTSYDLSDVTYDESKLSYTIKGAGATAETSYNESTALLTIAVKGDNYEADNTSLTTYTVQFAKSSEDGPAYDKETEYTSSILVYWYMYFTPTENNIKILTKDGLGTAGFRLNDFVFESMGNLGDIYVKELDIAHNADGSTSYFNTTPESVYVEGMGMAVPVGVNATVSADGNLTGTMTIDLNTETVDSPDYDPENVVTVTVGPLLTVNPEQNIEAKPLGLTNVSMLRTFAQGWNTLCLPFDFDIQNIGDGVKAQEFKSVSDGALNFEAVSDGILKAGVPYLVYCAEETTFGNVDEDDETVITPCYFSTTVNSYDPSEVTLGEYTFKGNYNASMSMKGLYGVADINNEQKIVIGGENSTLAATGAYFTTTAANANGMRISFDGKITGIIDAKGHVSEDGTVYSLQGTRVASTTRNLQKGVYIVNGKKVIR